MQVTGAATGGSPTISAQGSDTNIRTRIFSKGTGSVRLGNGTTAALDVFGGSSNATFNYFTMSVGGAGTGPVIGVVSGGTTPETNADLRLSPLGTGLVRFGTYTAGAPTATGYISIKAANGTTYKVLVGT